MQTHPAGGVRGTINLRPGGNNNRIRGSHTYKKHLDYRNAATAELKNNPLLSSPEECARACRENDAPRTCYYHFTLEYYTVLGA